MQLTLLIVDDPGILGRQNGGQVFCTTRLDFHRDLDVFAQLVPYRGGVSAESSPFYVSISPEELKEYRRVRREKRSVFRIDPQPWPRRVVVEINEEDGADRRSKDGFGNLLTFVCAKDLKRLDVSRDSWNKAIKAFIGALPDETPIILYWH